MKVNKCLYIFPCIFKLYFIATSEKDLRQQIFLNFDFME